MSEGRRKIYDNVGRESASFKHLIITEREEMNMCTINCKC